MADTEPDTAFEAAQQPHVTTQDLLVNLEGYSGPLDILLDLARNQKVDLLEISILDLAEQYLEFVRAARKVRLELAADYLVMAAWLAYLKSRLLLPEDEDDEDGPSGAEMAARLAFQLRRLEAMRQQADELILRDRLGRDVFARGMPEGVRVIRRSKYTLSMYELLKSYVIQDQRQGISTLNIQRRPIFSMEDALHRLERILGTSLPDWTDLVRFLPPELAGRSPRSALASTFAATLELARQGKLELKQSRAFGPLHLRSKTDEDNS